MIGINEQSPHLLDVLDQSYDCQTQRQIWLAILSIFLVDPTSCFRSVAKRCLSATGESGTHPHGNANLSCHSELAGLWGGLGLFLLSLFDLYDLYGGAADSCKSALTSEEQVAKLYSTSNECSHC